MTPLANYLVRRLLLSAGVLVALLAATYALARLGDVDPVARYLGVAGGLEGAGGRGGDDLRAYRLEAARLGLDRPSFFFWVAPDHYPDTLSRVLPLARRRQAEAFLRKRYRWPAVEDLQRVVWAEPAPAGLDARAARLATDLGELRASGVPAGVLAALESARSDAVGWPRARWAGARNGLMTHFGQYASGELGYSLQTGRPVGAAVARALGTTLGLGLIGLGLAMALAIPWGLAIARRRARHGAGAIAYGEIAAYVVTSIPGFLLATVVVTLGTGVGRPFPGPGWAPYSEVGLLGWCAQAALPILCLSYGPAAVLALVLAGSLSRGDRVPVREFARVLGLGERRIWWRDMLPLGLVGSTVTTAGMMIPTALGASVVIEYLFNIPGLGRLSLESVLARDWPVVVAVVWLGGLATVVAYTLIDLVNAALDPGYRKLVLRVD